MAADQDEFVRTGPSESLVINARLGAQPVVVWERPEYYSNMVVLDASPVQTPANLKGQKISFGDIGSTSQHLGPVKLMTEAGLVYSTDCEPVFLNRNVTVEALIAGEIGAIALNRTHIDKITEKFPDQKFRVIAKGEALPSDILLIWSRVSPEVVGKVRNTFIEHGADILAAVTATDANEKFIGGGFTTDVTDADYDSVRNMFANVGVTEFQKFAGEQDRVSRKRLVTRRLSPSVALTGATLVALVLMVSG